MPASDGDIGARATDFGAAVSSSAVQVHPVYFAAVFAWSMSAVSAVICAVVRMPLGNPHWFVFAKAVLLSGAVISCATVLAVSFVGRKRGGYATVLLSTLAVIFLPCLSWPLGAAADFVVYPALLILVSAGLWTISAAGRIRDNRLGLAATCGCLLGAGYFFVINARGYATVLTPELALVGSQHLDTLFHAAIANMIIKHGALSTGLDGLLAIKKLLGCDGSYKFIENFDTVPN